jgi:anti-sigma-K factor RskA
MSDLYDLDELLGAYALDALDADEQRRVDDYLAINPRARAEVQEHREVATMLAYTGMDAPDGLWDRIVSTLDEAPPSPGPELARVLPMDQHRRRVGPTLGRWVAATAAAALIAIAAIAVVDRSNVVDTNPLEAAVAQIRADRDSRSTRMVSAESAVEVEAIVDLQGHGFLLAGDLPQLPRSLTYQLWGVFGDQVISLGVLGPTPDIEMFTARGDLAAVAITIEPAGGVVSDGNPEGAYVGEFS